MKDSKRELEETCEITTVHENVVERVRSRMPDEDLLYDTAELFKGFDPDPDSLGAVHRGALRLRHCEPFEYDQVCGLTPAADPAADKDRQEPQERQGDLLFIG